MKQENRGSQIKLLVEKAKEQGYITITELIDYLPDTIVDPEQWIENVICTFKDMGIKVFDNAPDSDNLSMAEDAPAADDDSVDAAAAVLATVNSEFGRTTDQMRKMIKAKKKEIAKRIEDGLRQVYSALAQFPPAVERLLELFDAAYSGDGKLSNVMSGYIDYDDDTPITSENGQNAIDGAENQKPDPKEAKRRISELKRSYNTFIKSIREEGCDKIEKQRTKLIASFIQFKLVPPVTNELINLLKDAMQCIRSHEHDIMDICLDAGMDRKTFVTSFPNNETNLEWVYAQCNGENSTAINIKIISSTDRIREIQNKLQSLTDITQTSIREIKKLNHKMVLGEAKAGRYKEDMVAANHSKSITSSATTQVKTTELPMHLFKTINDHKSHFRILANRNVTLKELAKIMDMPVNIIREVIEAANEWETMCKSSISNSDPTDIVARDNFDKAMQNMLFGLTAREAKVLRMRFGIDMNTAHTLEEVAKQFDVTSERIRQIEARALRKLRHPTRSGYLRSFLDE